MFCYKLVVVSIRVAAFGWFTQYSRIPNLNPKNVNHKNASNKPDLPESSGHLSLFLNFLQTLADSGELSGLAI